MIGWTKFSTPFGTFQCHVTTVIEATNGSTGKVTKFEPSNTTNCTGTGNFNGCKLEFHETDNLPYHATITDNGRVDITGNIRLTIAYEGCLASLTIVTFTEVQLTPLKTGTRTVTGTSNLLGETAALGDPIAGFEIDGSTGGQAATEDIFGGLHIESATVSGEAELTSPVRCTYKVTAT